MGEQGANLWDLAKGLPARSLMRIEDFALFVHGLDHPEEVACGPAGEVYAGGEAGQINQVTLDGTHRRDVPGRRDWPVEGAGHGRT